MNPKDTYKVVSYNLRKWVWLGDDDHREYFYRWYWQVKLRSWVNHLFFMNCKTFVRSDMRYKLKNRSVIWK